MQAMIKVTGSLQKSTEIMKLSNALIKLPQISQTMREMSMEMTKVRPPDRNPLRTKFNDVVHGHLGRHHGGDARRYPRDGGR